MSCFKVPAYLGEFDEKTCRGFLVSSLLFIISFLALILFVYIVEFMGDTRFVIGAEEMCKPEFTTGLMFFRCSMCFLYLCSCIKMNIVFAAIRQVSQLRLRLRQVGIHQSLFQTATVVF